MTKSLLAMSALSLMATPGLMNAADASGGVGDPAAVATIQPVTDTAAVSEMVAAAVEAAIRGKLGAVGGPVTGAVVNLIIGQTIRPIVDVLSALVAHIGMAVPNALGELVEKLESGIGFDLNGDGFVGDPEEKADDK